MWSNPGKQKRPPLHLGVVAIQKGAFGSPSTMVANFTYSLMYTAIIFPGVCKWEHHKRSTAAETVSWFYVPQIR